MLFRDKMLLHFVSDVDWKKSDVSDVDYVSRPNVIAICEWCWLEKKVMLWVMLTVCVCVCVQNVL